MTAKVENGGGGWIWRRNGDELLGVGRRRENFFFRLPTDSLNTMALIFEGLILVIVTINNGGDSSSGGGGVTREGE